MTTAPPAPAARPAGVRQSPVTLRRVLRAELTKLTSVPSLAWLVVGTVATTAATAAVLGLLVRADDGRSGSWVVTSGFVLGQLGLLVLGVLVGAGEHTTGTARSTFTAVPRRLPVLAAQVAVTTAAVATAGALALAASVLATSGARAGGAPGLDLAEPGAARALVGFVVAGVAVALLGLGLGSTLRRPAGAVVAGVVLLLLGNQALAANPGPLTDTVRALLPSAGARLLQDDAALAALDATTRGPHLGTWGGGVVAAGWVLVALAAAAYRLRRHDLG